MKKCVALVLSLICVLGLVGCNKKSMNYIVSNEPSISGIVEEVNENSILIYIQTDGYPYGANCSVSLDVENEDGIYNRFGGRIPHEKMCRLGTVSDLCAGFGWLQ